MNRFGPEGTGRGYDGGTSQSSCYPRLLTGLASYTNGISEGMQAPVAVASEALAALAASCDPAFFPHNDTVVPQVAAWSKGLETLGQWTMAIGQAFDVAAGSGDLLSLPGGTSWYDPQTGATSYSYDSSSLGGTWNMSDAQIANLLPPQFQSDPFLGSSADQPVQWNSDPYASLLSFVANPRNDAGVGAAVLADTGQILSNNGATVAGAVASDAGKITDGLSAVVGATTEIKAGFAENGAVGALTGALHAGINAAGDYAGAAFGEFLGAGLGELGGPIGGIIGGLILGPAIAQITKDVFSPGTAEQTKHDVAGASASGSTMAADTQAEQQAVADLARSDPSLVPAAQQTITGTMTVPAPWVPDRLPRVQVSAYTPWHPAP